VYRTTLKRISDNEEDGGNSRGDFPAPGVRDVGLHDAAKQSAAEKSTYRVNTDDWLGHGSLTLTRWHRQVMSHLDRIETLLQS
jgi:hypothetical protein